MFIRGEIAFGKADTAAKKTCPLNTDIFRLFNNLGLIRTY
jgi:hypothetical protein